MKKRIFKAQTVLIILIVALLLGALFDLVYRAAETNLIFPKKYSELVSKYSKEFSVPEELIYATIKVESGFKSDAVSSVGAIGLMQMLPETYEWLAEKRGEKYDPALLYDPDTNIRFGTYYLQYLYSRFGSWEKATIAYNWGEGNFSAFLASQKYIEGDYSSIPVAETRAYVEKVNNFKEKYKSLYSERN